MSCWAYSRNELKDMTATADYQPCPGSKNCCAKGDLCLPNHMCYSYVQNNKVDYYPAGCQDQNFPTTDCPKWCQNEIQPSLVSWNGGNNTWTCCGVNGLGKPDCTGVTGDTFGGFGPNDPWSRTDYDKLVHTGKSLAVGVIVGIVIAGIIFLGMIGLLIFCCCCSRRAKDRRNRGKFVPLGSGRDVQNDQVVWNSNVHEHNELHEGPMGGYAAPPHGPASHGAPQYTVQGFR